MPFLLEPKHAFRSQSSERDGEELGDEEVVDDLLSTPLLLRPKCQEILFARLQDVLKSERRTFYETIQCQFNTSYGNRKTAGQE